MVIWKSKGIFAGAMEKLAKILGRKYGVGRQEALGLLSEADRVSFRKGHAVVDSGSFDDSIYIIEDGIWSGSKPTSTGDAVVWFAFSGEAVVDIFCYNASSPSPIAIISETESTAWRISKYRIETLCAGSIGIANLVRKIFETNAFHFEDDIVWMADKGNAGLRYSALVNEHPELILNIPLKKIASYLWMTPQSLSRIRAALAKEREEEG